MTKMRYLLLLFITTPVLAQPNSVKIDSFINATTLNCELGNQSQNAEFWDLMTIFAMIKQPVPNINGKPFLMGSTMVTGINQLSLTQIRHTNEIVENKNIDVNVQKYGLNFIQITAFTSSLQTNKGFEMMGNGYYFIIQEPVNLVKKQLSEHGVILTNMEIISTPSNTQLTCFITG